MTPAEYVRRRGYDPRIIPTGAAGPVPIACFPVLIPRGFEPSATDEEAIADMVARVERLPARGGPGGTDAEDIERRQRGE